MKLNRSILAPLAALTLLTAVSTGAASFQEDFASDPALHNWQVAGNPGLFRWNSTNHNLEVTWDSVHTNSYFCHPLGTSVSQNDDFTLHFEVRLTDFIAGSNPQMPNPFQLAVGLINLTNATHSGFHRGSGYESPNLVEFSFFPDPGGDWQWGPSLTAVMVDHTGFNWSSGGFSPSGLTSNDTFQVLLAYSGADRKLRTTLSRNGATYASIPDATLGASFEGFAVDHAAVCSYSDAGQDPAYAGSILAHGTVDNFKFELITPQPRITGSFGNQVWIVQVTCRSNYLYQLERSTNLVSWLPVSSTVIATGSSLELHDPNPPAGGATYRVRVQRP
jgi:hypothetical protein